MRFPPRRLDWWPGLYGLWVRGQLSSLGVALAFAATWTALLVCTLVRPDLLPAAGKLVGWCAWGMAWAVAVSQLRPWAATLELANHDQDLFIQAQAEYLRGDWGSARATLTRCLKKHAGDVEARLLLATLCRREGDQIEARRHLQQLQRALGSEPWCHEIGREFGLLTATDGGDAAMNESAAA